MRQSEEVIKVMSMRRQEVKRGVEVVAITAVCKCIDVSDINARVSCSEAHCKGANDKGSAQVP